MLDFSDTITDYHFSLSDRELEILRPVFSQFREKTGLYIDEYGDIRLIPQNLELIVLLAVDYMKALDKQSTKTVMKFISNLRPMIKEGNIIFVSGD